MTCRRRKQQIKCECERVHVQHEWECAKKTYSIAFKGMLSWCVGIAALSVPIVVSWYIIFTL